MSPDFYRLVCVIAEYKWLGVVGSFFSQTVYLMEEDDSIFCISAWNDFVSFKCGVMCSVSVECWLSKSSIPLYAYVDTYDQKVLGYTFKYV